MRVSFFGLVFAILSVGKAAGIVIDDFSVGELSQVGPSTGVISQTGLDAAHVIGGARHVHIASGPVELSIDASLDVRVGAGTGWGYYEIMYGYDAPLQADFTKGGHDRIRLVFNDLNENWWRGGFWVSVNSSLPPNSSAPGPDFLALHGGGIFEIPFTRYNTDFSNVDTFAIEVIRMENLLSFSLDEIVTAGPPLSGDFDRNGVVDGGDLAEWQRTYGRRTNTFGGYLSTDANQDGRVDGRDFLAWQRAYGGSGEAAYGLSIPEPTTFLSFAVGAMLVTAGRRRADG